MLNMSHEILAERSRELLKDQLNSIDSNNSKAATITSLSALFIPICFSLFEKFAEDQIWITLFFLPILINLAGIFYLVLAMYPKFVYHGINFTEFDNLIEKDPKDVNLFEIGINRDCYNDNIKAVNKQNTYIRIGIKLIFFSAILLSLLFFVNLSLNKSTMSNNNQTPQNQPNIQPPAQPSPPQQPRQIPSTNPSQRAVIEKGGGDKGDLLKK